MRARPCRGFLIIALALLAQTAAAVATELGPGAGSYRITAPDGVVRIPFELFRDDIRMIGEINGREVRMLIDNGSLWDQLLFFGSPRVDALDLERDGVIEVRGSGGGASTMSETASSVALSFPGIEFTDQPAVITGYEPGRPNLWEGAEGQVSSAFFKNFVVDVDFDAMVLTLVEPERFTPRHGATVIALMPLGGDSWAIPANVTLWDGRRLATDVALDLGYGHALSVATGGPGDFAVPQDALPASLGWGMNGEIIGHFARVPGLEIGGHRLVDVLATYEPHEMSGFADAEIFIGMGVFRQFNVAFDYPGERIYVEPSRRFGERAEHDMSGLELRPDGNGRLVVTRVLPDSPAAEIGLRVGDRIDRLDGRPVTDLDREALRALMRRPGETVDLVYLRDGVRAEGSLELRPLI